MITYEQRESAYDSATKTQQHMYSGYGAGVPIYSIAQKHKIQSHTDFAIAIGDVILGLVPQEKLPELLVERLGVERPAAMRITADVLDFLAPLDEPQPEASDTATTVPINNPEPTNDNSLASEIAEAEAAMKTMQPIRTMSQDMEVMRGTPTDEPTHTAASQDDLLKQTQTKPAEPSSQRWGTEQT
jgi:hypothetical protein